MDDRTKQSLWRRNQRLIEAIIIKAQKVCPDAVDLIGIYGSFCTGDIHEKSDLDLLIVTNSEEGRKVSACFILGEVAHDFYCTTWESMERLALYKNPHIAKIMEANIVYSKDDQQLQRLKSIQQTLTEKLSSPCTLEDYSGAEVYLKGATLEYARVMMNHEWGVCLQASASMLHHLENALCMLNKTYFRGGTRRTPHELRAFHKLPEGFMEKYGKVLRARTVNESKDSSSELIRLVTDYFVEQKSLLQDKKQLAWDHIQGSYEEIYSNWRNKMYRAAECDDVYAALMAAMGCQCFYDELYDECAVEKLNVMETFQKENLHASAQAFDGLMERYQQVYNRLGKKPAYYQTIEDFLQDYLGQA
ncbi:MAG: nucleotidyltransferase domain-containing protein [Limnochordia bacterium]|nr:nucleotidyltransferase domain-containing protein [Limnochordia bacterium]